MPDEPAQEPEAARRARSRRRADRRRLNLSTPATPPSGVPTFESVREKIETRYGTAIGAAELDAETPEGRTVEEQYDARQRAAAERLAQIRESMRKPTRTLSSRIRRPGSQPGTRRRPARPAATARRPAPARAVCADSSTSAPTLTVVERQSWSQAADSVIGLPMGVDDGERRAPVGAQTRRHR